jgi:hypothetical protein
MNETNFTRELAEELLETLKSRFQANQHRHAGISWDTIEARLRTHVPKLWSLYMMEKTGGEPDVFALDASTGEVLFYDFSAETPLGRRNFCYDRAAWDSRKENKPESSAMEKAENMGVIMLNEDEYRALQTLGEFDRKTSSWIETPAAIRALGGALFCDRRYNHVFTYHNGAESYYGVRGFRAKLSV